MGNWQTPHITLHTGTTISFNTGSITSGYTYEFSGSVKLNNNLKTDGFTILSNVTSSFTNDAAAAAGGVPLQGLYRSGSYVLIRLT